MGAMTNLLVKDDAASPVETTLVPVTDTPNPFWRASTAGISLYGQLRLTASVESLKSGDYKVTAKLEVPVMETLGASGTSAGYVAPQQVAYTTTCIMTMFVSKRSTPADRANALKLITGLVQGASSTTATGTLSQASAGSAFGSSTAPITRLFTNLEVPN